MSSDPVEVLHFTDPGCPWAYSAEPALTALRYRYGAGLRWRRIMIGLSETKEQYDARGYRPERSAASRTTFARRFGMPFVHHARTRNQATAPSCLAVKAAELQGDLIAEATLRAMRFGYFASDRLMDTVEGIRAAAALAEGLDVERMFADAETAAVRAAYDADRAETRLAAETGTVAIAQGKTFDSDGAERFTAPSLVFRRGGQAMVAGGWQSLEAYDVCVVNLAPDLERQPVPTPEALLPSFPYGLTTEEVAVACTDPLDEVDRHATLQQLLLLEAAGAIGWRQLGGDALWFPPG